MGFKSSRKMSVPLLQIIFTMILIRITSTMEVCSTVSLSAGLHEPY